MKLKGEVDTSEDDDHIADDVVGTKESRMLFREGRVLFELLNFLLIVRVLFDVLRLDIRLFLNIFKNVVNFCFF